MIKRRDFRLDELLEGSKAQMTLDLDMVGWEFDAEINAFIPLPIREFPPIHYKRVKELSLL